MQTSKDTQHLNPMKYKLTEITLDLRAGTVLCRCTFTIQAVYQVDFTLNEADLYAAAQVDGRDSWDNEDVISVAKEKLNVDVEL